MQIWVQKETQRWGPFTEETLNYQIAAGVFSADDFGWFEGAPSWVQLSQIPGLLFIRQTPQTAIPALNVNPVAHGEGELHEKDELSQLRRDLYRAKLELEDAQSKEEILREELKKAKQQNYDDRGVSEETSGN